MELLLCGNWLGKDGLFKASIGRVKLLKSLGDIEPLNLGFLVISYSMAEESVNVKVKASNLPPIIMLEIQDLSPLAFKPERIKLRELGSSLDEEGYKERVKKVRELIADGVIYQLNLTCRFDFGLEGNPKDLFLNYYRAQPVPYAFFLDMEGFYLISGSMELFLEKREETVRSKPIKGTSKSKEELLNSLKDRAENLMITDMVRNDLSKIALSGSVKVRELFKVEAYSTLFQMHSEVVARTKESLPDILMATFPPASVVGAPKKKAVETIDLLEPNSRDYYCGCAGLIKGEDFTLSVLIRTALGFGELVHYYAGAGIVWDSEPQREWEEVRLKSLAFRRVSYNEGG